jgi:hypothetical protein
VLLAAHGKDERLTAMIARRANTSFPVVLQVYDGVLHDTLDGREEFTLLVFPWVLFYPDVDGCFTGPSKTYLLLHLLSDPKRGRFEASFSAVIACPDSGEGYGLEGFDRSIEMRMK